MHFIYIINRLIVEKNNKMPCDEDAGCPSEPLTVDALRRHDERERHTQALQLEDQYECIMCCETIPVSHLTILPCGHEFHAECIRNWVYHRREGGPRYPGGQSKCPLCRRSLLYLCKHRISKYLLRPGVQIRMYENMLCRLVFSSSLILILLSLPLDVFR